LDGIYSEIFAKSIMEFGLKLFETSNEVSELLLSVFDGKGLPERKDFFNWARMGAIMVGSSFIMEIKLVNLFREI